MPRFAFSDPSIGSITTCERPAAADRHLAALLRHAVSGRPNASSSANTASSAARSIDERLCRRPRRARSAPSAPRCVVYRRHRGAARRRPRAGRAAQPIGALCGFGASRRSTGRRILGRHARPRRRPERSISSRPSPTPGGRC